jgi:hypothetical protein
VTCSSDSRQVFAIEYEFDQGDEGEQVQRQVTKMDEAMTTHLTTPERQEGAKEEKTKEVNVLRYITIQHEFLRI